MSGEKRQKQQREEQQSARQRKKKPQQRRRLQTDQGKTPTERIQIAEATDAAVRMMTGAVAKDVETTDAAAKDVEMTEGTTDRTEADSVLREETKQLLK